MDAQYPSARARLGAAIQASKTDDWCCIAETLAYFEDAKASKEISKP